MLDAVLPARCEKAYSLYHRMCVMCERWVINVWKAKAKGKKIALCTYSVLLANYLLKKREINLEIQEHLLIMDTVSGNRKIQSYKTTTSLCNNACKAPWRRPIYSLFSLKATPKIIYKAGEYNWMWLNQFNVKSRLVLPPLSLDLQQQQVSRVKTVMGS